MHRIAAAVCVVCAGSARADFITFQDGPFGAQPDGFMTPESSTVAFSDSIGENLSVELVGDQGFGWALVNRFDDASRLQMAFSTNVGMLELWYGNDDGGFVGGSEIWAVLRGFKDGVETGYVAEMANGDDIMNQTISITGDFDSVEFYYASGANGVPIGLGEIVDNIRFSPVPAPSALALMGIVWLVDRRGW